MTDDPRATDRFRSWVDRYGDRDPATDTAPSPLIPAATVVLVRDGPDGLEVLMVERNRSLSFAGGMWVFPGGRVDPADRRDADDDERDAARRAAVREAEEETGLVIDAGRLVELSHWTPPPESPKRFGTWFFLGPAPPSDVVVDGGEILAHRWTTPRDAHTRRDAGEIELAPPTWITLAQLAPYRSTGAALEGVDRARTEQFTTKIVIDDDRVLALYHGDHAYETGDSSGAGPVHRLTMGPLPWRYERSD